MAIKLKQKDTYSTYFITFTCFKWITLFEITDTYDMVYKWFTVLNGKDNAGIVAYVIMPNHLHLIVHFHKDGFNLNTIVADGKRFMAYEIINRLENCGEGGIAKSAKKPGDPQGKEERSTTQSIYRIL